MEKLILEKRQLSLIVALIFLFPILNNSIKIFGNLILLILFIMGSYIALSKSQNPFRIKELQTLSWITVGYFLIMLFSILHADGLSAEFHHLGRKIHFLLAPIIALSIFQADIPLERILLSIKIGLITIGSIVTIQFFLGHERPSGMINANIFSDISVAMFFMSIVRIFDESTKERVVTLIAALSGASAILLSGSRGSWLSFIILTVVYIGLIYKPFVKNNNNRKIFLVLALLLAVVFVSTATNVDKRVNTAISQIHDWNSNLKSHTSLGLRMEMWKSGLTASYQAPWFGYGYRNANQIAAKYASSDKETIKAFTHLHNEYITNLVSAGVVGLFSLLSLLLVPLTIFYQNLANKSAYFYSSMGVLLCSGYATFGFSHIAFGEEHINAFYIFFLGVLLPTVIKITISETQQKTTTTLKNV